MNKRIVFGFCHFLLACLALGGEAAPTFKPVPIVQAIPLPNQQISFQRDGFELTRYHFAPRQLRPFLFPINGPSGRSLTRMGHPRDPVTHSHHNSVWISHADVDGVSFWEDKGKGQIMLRRVEQFEDGDKQASVKTVNEWVLESGRVLLSETRRITSVVLPQKEWMLIVDLRLEPIQDPVTLGKTPFGLIGVRMVKTIGVNDGGGTIRNSEGGINEAGVFWKPARWVDYSGAIGQHTLEGIALMDHPANPNHPSVFHVRNDGWMGASLTFHGSMRLEKGKPLILRYALYVHAGSPSLEAIEGRWKEFAVMPPDTAR